MPADGPGLLVADPDRRHPDGATTRWSRPWPAPSPQVRVGDPFDADHPDGPAVAERQRDRVEGYIAKGKAEGATLATGGGRPKHLDRGYYVEPTVFGNVDNSSTIAQEEIFGPVLSVIPADDEEQAIAIANDTIYGLNASVFTNDVDRARDVAGQLRSGTVGHNAFRTDFSIAFGGFKQSGIGREGGTEGLLPFLETKTVILEVTGRLSRLSPAMVALRPAELPPARLTADRSSGREGCDAGRCGGPGCSGVGRK